jgi:hypothetical protein
MVPASIARTPSFARSLRRSGTSAPMPPICMPIEPRLANPHSANVAMVNERGSSAAFSAPKRDVGDHFVERHARAQQVADGQAVVPRHADEPRHGREEVAENLPQLAGNPVKACNGRAPSRAGMSSSATSARKLMSMMATFMASLPPSMVPRAMAPIRFSSLCSSSLGMTTCLRWPGFRSRAPASWPSEWFPAKS